MQFSLGLGLALLGLQTLLARRLSARVKALTTNRAALRRGTSRRCRRRLWEATR